MKKEKKIAIRTVAARCFAEQGYERTSIELIARQTGVAQGLVRYYFSTKEQLYFEAAHATMSALKKCLMATPDIQDGPRAAVRRFVLDYMAFTSDPDNAYGLIYQESPFKILRDPCFVHDINTVSLEILDILREILAAVLPADQALETATIIVTSLHGIQRARLSPKLRELINLDRVADFFSSSVPDPGSTTARMATRQQGRP